MKALIDFFIDRYKATFTFLFFLLIWGITSVQQMPAAAYSDINIPYVFIATAYDGVSAQDAERLVTRPLEQKLKTVDELVDMQSYSRQNMSYLILEFPVSYSKDKAVQDVRDLVDETSPDLPAESETPLVQEFSLDQFPILDVNLISNASNQRELLAFARELQDLIEAIPEVLEADLRGVPDDLLEATIDKNKLESYNVSPRDLYNAIADNNRAIPAGNLRSSTGKFGVLVPSVFESVSDVENIPVIESRGKVITLKDLVNLRRTYKDRDSFSRVNGKDAVTLSVLKKTDAREVIAAGKVNAVIDSVRPNLPEGIELVITQDRTGWSSEMVYALGGNILTAMLLVMMIVVSTMGLRSSGIVAMAIPTCFVSACIFLSSIDYNFNFMVCFGFLISLGMLIDGCVVVSEYADRKMSEGYNRIEAYKISAKRMFWPVTVSSATTLAIFVPLLFWEGVSGQFMRPMIVTLFTVLTASLFYTLIFTPAIGSRFGNLGKRKSKTLDNVAVLENGNPTEIDGITGIYARILNKLIDAPGKFIVFVMLIVVTIGSLYMEHAPGSRFFIEEEPIEMEIKIEGRGSFAETEKLGFLKEVEEIVLSIPGPKSFSLNMNGAGDPRDRGNADEIGTIFIEMPFEKDLKNDGWTVYDALVEKTKDIPGLRVTASVRENGPPQDSPIEITIFGSNEALLKKATMGLTNYMKNSVPGAKNVYNTIPTDYLKWTVKIDKEKAKQFGVTTTDIGTAIQFMTAGIKVGEYRPKDLDEEVDIRVRFPENQRRLDQFSELTVNTRFGQAPLSSFVKIEPNYIAPSIRRVSAKRAYTIAGEYAKGALIEDVAPKIEQWVLDNNEYEELQFKFGGQQEEIEANTAFFISAFFIGVFLMSILLMIQLNSFYQIFVIVSAVMLSTSGVLLGLLVTQSIYSAIFTSLGIVSLAGIVVNNNIVLVDTYNVITKTNPELSRKEIIIRTAAQRFRPIILTTATTVIGLLPLALGVGIDLYAREIELTGRVIEWWQPMSFAVVCGLTFASVLTLFLTPCWLMLPVSIKNTLNNLINLFKKTASD